MRVIIVVCLLGLVIDARSEGSCEGTDSKPSHEVASTYFVKAANILDLYHGQLANAISWQDIIRPIARLWLQQDKLDSESKRLLTIIDDSVGSAHQNYIDSRTVGSWCANAMPKLRRYLSLFGDFSREKAENQKCIVIAVLKESVEKLNAALGYLDKCIANLSKASGKFSSLDNQVEIIRNKRIEEAKRQNDEALTRTIMHSFMFSASGRMIFSEFDLRPVKDIDEIRDSYSKIRGLVTTATNKITHARNEFQREILTLTDLQCQAHVTQVFVQIRSSIKYMIINHANNLIGKCKVSRP